MELTIQQVIDLNNLFQKLNNQAFDFYTARKIANNITILNAEIQKLQLMLKSPYQDAYNSYREELETLRYAYAQKDGLGNVVYSNNDVVIRSNDINEFGLKVQELELKYRKDIDHYALICNEYLTKVVDIKLDTFLESECDCFKLSPEQFNILNLIMEK